MSLVVVDDDRYIVSLLEDVFEQEGLAVRSFTSSVEAQKHLTSHAADIVITDIKMPEITGLDLLREIHSVSPETIVIIITGYSSLQTTLEAVQLGAFDYITKPFLLGEVKLVVQRAIEQIGLRSENQRLSERLSELEGEFTRLQSNFESLSKEFVSLGEQLHLRPGLGAQRMLVPESPARAIKPYADQAQTSESRYGAKLDLLEELVARGVLSERDFENAKRRLAEATGKG